MIPKIDYVVIENVYPEIDNGRNYVKRTIGDLFRVEADIFSHGHEVIHARLLYRKKGQKRWTEIKMEHMDNDRWFGVFKLLENTFYEYTVFAWRDPFFSWAADTHKKFINNVDIKSDLMEGIKLITEAIERAKGTDKKRLKDLLNKFEDNVDIHNITHEHEEHIDELITGKKLLELMEKNADRSSFGRYENILNVYVNREIAQFASWYEMWPRSQGTVEGQSATFEDMENRLDYIKDLGFNVVYLTPIHPVGETNRKGPNNSLECPPGSPGCPYAIGNADGGHKSIEPTLGTLEGFEKFVKRCHAMDLEVALDLAVQASPDHPWVKSHPEWFNHRPDGTIKYAENPPKKYEDIYPINFDTEDEDGLWNEILETFKFWMDKGVRIFRVDNPHTKPVFFWKWLIETIHTTDPDIIFLSEAFTRPKMMKKLAKIGFNQSYTYFTWRNYKYELIDYFTELTQSEVSEYMIGNLFTNTPDILPKILQNAPPAAFKMRATLACTLSSVWGMYNGFELCEGAPVPGKEEYIHSEKYDFKVWDWNRPGNIKEYIKKLNEIRMHESALRSYKNLKFYRADNDNILFYGKHTDNMESVILIIVNLDPYSTHDSFVYVPIYEYGIQHHETYIVQDLITNEKYYWKGEQNYIKLDPEKESAHILKIVHCPQ